MNAFEKKYVDQVRIQMKEKFGYRNLMAVPKIEKISINVGLSKAAKDSNFLEDAKKDLQVVTGQNPIFSKAKKAIAGFKIRQGQDIGMTVTLRGKRMWDFAYRLVAATIPRIKDFQGISHSSFDKQGNLSLGIKEQLIFPEISTDDVSTIFGLQVNISTTANSKEEGIALLKFMGFPLQEEQ